jgi:hypothetical protein
MQNNLDHEISEKCSCINCVTKYRDIYKSCLDNISQELGLPIGIGPAKGVIKNMKTKLNQVLNCQIGTSAHVDFEACTWTLKMKDGFLAGAGDYYLVRLDKLSCDADD